MLYEKNSGDIDQNFDALQVMDRFEGFEFAENQPASFC